MKIAVIGGGAAGFFAALAAKKNYPDAYVIVLEKSTKFLSKVKVSGGGRCNVTNGETKISKLAKAYPRGEKLLKKAFREFNTSHVMAWFESRGVELMTQDDNCVFPVSQNSQTIIDCFLDEAKKLDVKLALSCGVKELKIVEEKIHLDFIKPVEVEKIYDSVIVATGGSPKRSGLLWLEKLGHEIEEPVPSLFTFNMPYDDVTNLMGVVVESAIVKIQGSKLVADGPLLITHWGMSGPAILKLSAFGARYLSELGYCFKIQVNWVNIVNYEEVAKSILAISQSNSKKRLTNFRPYGLPERLWHHLLSKAGFHETKIWGELGKKGIHKITTILTNDVYDVAGKTTFKEEFVTCGGVSLRSIDSKTMQSKIHPQVYFAGEVMDIDGITGGYNFQAAWTTAFISGKLK